MNLLYHVATFVTTVFPEAFKLYIKNLHNNLRMHDFCGGFE
ncbi:hypothetical protein SBF1_4360003 [Candidatus Desulfosporosinus infrequens]|uniref:Uncharacterized protein n=1 Tax=Candidatus Desulfosporosinus infrequens TaxID=2043169 RepID=A0A2U3LB71_9FIRM|nr:hypothetical protein SBF1_4360003 [Candidatus Desulfosporosinus infrequens]